MKSNLKTDDVRVTFPCDEEGKKQPFRTELTMRVHSKLADRWLKMLPSFTCSLFGRLLRQGFRMGALIDYKKGRI